MTETSVIARLKDAAGPKGWSDDPKEIALAEKFVARLNMRAIGMEGTCTGEHGVGQGKVGFLRHEIGHGVDVMRTIKQALDPLNIMNPGKILPAS